MDFEYAVFGSESEDLDMNAEQKAVLTAFERMQQAMIDKDSETMLSLVTEDKTFTHMSGKAARRTYRSTYLSR